MKKTGLLIILASVLFGILLTGACRSSDSALEDTRWVLESYGDAGNPRDVIEGSTVTATFNSEDNRITGKAGCNTYFGEYNLDDGLAIGMLGNTEMYCMEPEGVMDQEMEYLALLGYAESYTIENGVLTITCGMDVLSFRAEE